jgi:hypothetical protein
MDYPVSVTCNIRLVLKSDRSGIERYGVASGPLSPLRSVFPLSPSGLGVRAASAGGLFVAAGKAQQHHAKDRLKKKQDRWPLSTGR